jgi:hypothetical protein
MASRPRVIGYVVNNIEEAPDAELAASVSGVTVKNVGRDVDSCRALLAEIERPDRDCPIVLVSPTMDGHYLINSKELQERLIGLGQVVQGALADMVDRKRMMFVMTIWLAIAAGGVDAHGSRLDLAANAVAPAIRFQAARGG